MQLDPPRTYRAEKKKQTRGIQVSHRHRQTLLLYHLTSIFEAINTVSMPRSRLGTNKSVKACGAFSRFVRCGTRQASLFRVSQRTACIHNCCCQSVRLPTETHVSNISCMNSLTAASVIQCSTSLDSIYFCTKNESATLKGLKNISQVTAEPPTTTTS